ncbi:hypothetical protein FY046_21060 [Erwinia sp. 1181_3]|nr:hypothetical protein [Erwinia rhapontici]
MQQDRQKILRDPCAFYWTPYNSCPGVCAMAVLAVFAVTTGNQDALFTRSKLTLDCTIITIPPLY